MVTTSMTTGGIQSVVRDLSEQLASAGHTVGVVSLSGKDEVVTAPGVKRWCLEIDQVGKHFYKAQRGVRTVLREFGPDVLHAHAFHANVASQLATLGGSGVPCIRTFHSVREGGAVHRLVARLPMGKSSSVAVSQAVASAHGLPRETAVHYNAVNLEKFAFSDESRARVRTELALGARDVLALSVGRLTAAKDYRTFVAAASMSLARNPNLTVAIVGEGPMRDELSRTIDSYGYSTRIRLLGQRSDVPALMSAADVYVQSSAWEGFPVALIEAMSSGLPIVATDVGGTRELRPVPDRLLKAGDAPSMSEAMLDACSALKNPSERLAGVAALSRYSLTTWTAGWIEEYEKALRG
ncbi:glycosyltransferase [Nocardioides sediminis]|uniref:glycosyltransferase n=1 Tax=Nocardioides sediminis TaxID=433648 RepID=UPI000D3241B8|nr:glycosyltransferase [Nocardioides sediminis]